VPFLHLFDGYNFVAKISELDQFLLNCLQPFVPLAVSDLSISVVPALTPIPFVQILNLSYLPTEMPDLLAQNFEVIHITRIAHLDCLSVGRQTVREIGLIRCRIVGAGAALTRIVSDKSRWNCKTPSR
jgi:hypothetical protein